MTSEGGWDGLSVTQRYRDATGAGSAVSTAATRGAALGPFRARLILTDGVLLGLSMLVGLLVSSRASAWAISPVLAIYGVPVAIMALWWAMLALRGSYDQRFIGLGTEEIRRVVSATLYTFAVVAGLSYLVRADISRAYAFVSLPLGVLLVVSGRFAWRGWLYRRRADRLFMNHTVVVGTGRVADELCDRLERETYAGYLVAGRYPAPTADDDSGAAALEAWLAGLDDLVDRTEAAAVAIAPSESLTGEAVRQVAWHLEGRSVDLLIAPAMMDVGGPRLSVRPAAGLPLLHLDEAALSRPQRFAKRALDLVGSAILIVVLSPVLVTCALAVRLSSRGPVIFRQVRIGQGGEPFTMLKFRTMVDGADDDRQALRHEHELHEPGFKLPDDPRVTRVGRFLRRWSLDELPQLLNVVGGSMSLVGPRPHPLDDVNRYEQTAYRRLALKPGMTGLWQVEGRSDLDWAQALQLDLFYVESWSLSGDVVLLARTVRAVLRGRGAV
ncbi:MAG: exopolysaccharide biosynthesis polyprenyl glycosylphosphotransferase [Actinomycetales bacterium]|nr:exopolysaccharide biosynthesis polyprenyl glycosylphosphotransferase [Actinomycetales bacterium]